MAPRKAFILALLFILVAVVIYVYQGGLISRGGLAPIKPAPMSRGVDEANITLTFMDAWLVRDLNDEGYFDYEYYPSNGSRSGDNNMIRQLMASRTLAELARSDERFMSLHRKNLGYVFANWYRRDGERGYIFYDNGSFRAYYIEPGYTYDSGYVLSFYSGEAILGLLDYYNMTGDTEAFDAAVRAQDYYVGEYADRMDDNYCPFYVPWHTMTLYRIYNITGERKYMEAAFKLNDRLIKSQEPSGRFSDVRDIEYGQPHSAVVALYTDGLTYAYELAAGSGDNARTRAYGRSISRGLAYLSGLQYRDENDPATFGALRADSNNIMIRVDATQHAIDAFRRALRIYTINTNGEHG